MRGFFATLTRPQKQSIRFRVLLRATDGFNEKNVIGEGGYGKVYKGVLEDGREVAVKRRNKGATQGAKEFEVEREVLSSSNHPNLVSLIGHCDEEGEFILVYEYMRNGTLNSHLYGGSKPTLSWKDRLQICVAVAKALHYLHTTTPSGTIHRDVKSDNILIDDNLCAKLGDLGLSVAGPMPPQKYVFTTQVMGTPGYIDPKYFETQELTVKSDVYSFGVVLLEVLSARPVYDPSLPEEKKSLVPWGKKMLEEGKVGQIVDKNILDTNQDNLHRFGYIVWMCLAEETVQRPTMEGVLTLLEFELISAAASRDNMRPG